MAAPAPAAAPPPLVLDAHADTLDHVVRAVAHSGFLEEAVKLMLASPEHLHDPELLYRTRGVRGAGGRTLLMCAMVRLDVARAAEILGACPTGAARAGLLASVVDVDGCAALHLACHPDRLDEDAALRVAELLLANGADVLALRRNPSTGAVHHAVHLAARWSARLVQRLVQVGASIDGDVAATPTLCVAATAGTAQGVRMLPQLVALGTPGNQAMLLFARSPVKGAQPSDAEVAAALEALVSVGCSPTQPDGDGWTPLDCAACNCNAPVARALLALGVPATTASLIEGVKHPEMVRVLLAAGAPVDALVDVAGPAWSPLMAAAHAPVLESVEALLAAGASVDLRDAIRRTALMYSLSDTFDPRVTKALLAAGADVDARIKNGWTALHWLADTEAQRPWAAGAARLLLQRGASARAVDLAGCTPAQCIPAAQRGGTLHRLLLKAAAA